MNLKHNSLSILFFFFSISFLPNTNGQLCTPLAQIDLDGNNVRARLPQGGALWWNFSDAGYIVPKDNPDQVAAIFAGGFWLGGVDPGGNLKLSAVTYGQNGQIGSAGPLINGSVDPMICQQFDRFWEINLPDITAHINDFNDNGIIDNPIASVFSWPGKGNANSLSYNGFDLPDLDLAPFKDYNNNGVYEPSIGEYPEIKGDQSIWWMFNSGESSSFFSPRANWSVLAYGFNSSDEILRHTTYYDVTVENGGLEPLDSAFVGIWVDPDLGCYADDYIGCLPDEDLAFVYNADAVDGDPGCFGIADYGDEVPVLGIKYLKGITGQDGMDIGMSSFIYYNNPSVGTPSPMPATSDPQNEVEYYSYLNGRWRDGTPITEGGNGYNTGGPITNYAFAGNPSDVNDWSMCSELIPNYDQRMLLNSGPFSLQPAERNDFSFAVIWIADQPHPCPDMTVLIEASDIVVENYDNATSTTEELKFDDISIFPNPFSNETKIQIKGDKLIEKIQILTMDGKIVRMIEDIHSSETTIQEENFQLGYISQN